MSNYEKMFPLISESAVNMDMVNDTNEKVKQFGETLKPLYPVVEVNIISILKSTPEPTIWVSFQPKDEWTNNIKQNAEYISFSIDYRGDMVVVNRPKVNHKLNQIGIKPTRKAKYKSHQDFINKGLPKIAKYLESAYSVYMQSK